MRRGNQMVSGGRRAQRLATTGTVVVLLAALAGPPIALAAAPPANDLFANAVELDNASLPYGPVTIDTTGAIAAEPNEPGEVFDCQGDYFGHPVYTAWYR